MNAKPRGFVGKTNPRGYYYIVLRPLPGYYSASPSERHAAKYAATKVRNGCANVFRPYEANSFATSKILRCPVALG